MGNVALSLHRLVGRKGEAAELGFLRLSFSLRCLRLVLAEVKRRGRCLADRGVLRYEKHGKLLRQLRTVPFEQIREARAAAVCLPTALKAALDRLLQKPFLEALYGRLWVVGLPIASEAASFPRAHAWLTMIYVRTSPSLPKEEIE